MGVTFSTNHKILILLLNLVLVLLALLMNLVPPTVARGVSSTKAKSTVRKENKIQKLTRSMEEAQKGMVDMATELCELRGLPEAIRKQFEEQQAKGDGKYKEKPEPLMTMSQWKELLETNQKASSLYPYDQGRRGALCKPNQCMVNLP